MSGPLNGSEDSCLRPQGAPGRDSTVKVVKGRDIGGREQEDTESIGAFRCELINVWNFSDAVINIIHFFIHSNP